MARKTRTDYIVASESSIGFPTDYNRNVRWCSIRIVYNSLHRRRTSSGDSVNIRSFNRRGAAELPSSSQRQPNFTDCW